MSPEEAQNIFYAASDEAHREAHAFDKPAVQAKIQLASWTAVVAAMRKEYEVELERLRQENRDLKEIIVLGMEANA